MNRDDINDRLNSVNRLLQKAAQLSSVRDALVQLGVAQQWLNDKNTIIRDYFDPLLDKKPIETFTDDELISEIRRRMHCGSARG